MQPDIPSTSRAERAAAPSDAGDLLSRVQRAHQLVDTGDAQQALLLADALIADNPELGRAYAARARALRKLARPVESLSAWQAAVNVDPWRARFRLGLGHALAATGRVRAACASYEQAAGLAPDDIGVCRTASLFLLQAGNPVAAARLLRTIGAAAGADDAMRAETRLAVTIIDEGRRIEPVLRLALAKRDPGRLADVLAATPPDLLQQDETLLGRLATMARFVPRAALAERPRWDPRRVAGRSWPVVEAHFKGHFGDRVNAVVDSLNQVARLQGGVARAQRASGAAGADRAADDRVRALVAGARAIRERDALSWTVLDPIGWECRVRYFHALMNADQPAVWPGRFKPLPNKVKGNRAEPRSRPSEVAGTVRAFADRALHGASHPLVRAVLCMYFFAKLHAFFDGNGGMGRFFASAELVAAGWGPLIVPDALREEINVAIRRVHRSDEIDGLVDVLAKALDWRDAFLDELGAAAVSRP